MSKLIVEVCKIDKIESHPNADRLEICKVKGWSVIVGKDNFVVGQKCVFFPPDSVLPSPLIDRLGVRKYLHALPKNSGLPDSGRVIAARLRGEPSYGTIMPLDAAQGDDLDWEVGTDVAAHFGVTKYEPPASCADGQAASPCSKFYRYTEIENFANYIDAIPEGTEVVYTEKIHGKNCRVGLVLDGDDEGQAEWTYMAGSHDVRRKEFYSNEKQILLEDLITAGACKELPAIDDILMLNGRYWKTIKILNCHNVETDTQYFKVQLSQVDRIADTAEDVRYVDHTPRSEFWLPLTDNVKEMLEYIRDMDWAERKYSIMLYGELFGAGCQDMQYGLDGISFRAFDISINNKYLDFDDKVRLLTQFNVAMVPILYRGPFSIKSLEEHTSGPTTLCDPAKAGKFKGREGIVAVPVKEVHYCPVLNKRRIVKSVSADYHARKDGTEFH